MLKKSKTPISLKLCYETEMKILLIEHRIVDNLYRENLVQQIYYSRRGLEKCH
jgi:hypothetical protein